MLGALSSTILNLTDTAFMARVGETELASMAIASIFHFVLFMPGFALSTGTQIIIARRAGENNRSEINRLVDHGFIILLVSAIACSLISLFVPQPLFSYILRSEAVANAGTDYVQIRSLGLLTGITGLAFRSFFVGIGRTNVLTIAAIGMTILNILLDYVLIFGELGIPAMGIKGAAWATVIAESLGSLIIAIYPFITKRFNNYSLLKFKSFSIDIFRSIIKISAPLILQHILSMGAWFIFFVMIEKMGERALAISNVVRAVYMVFMTPIWGFASATNSMVSNMMGQKKFTEIFVLVRRILVLSVSATAVIIGIDILGGDLMLKLVSDNAILIKESLSIYRIVVIAMFIFSISIILLNSVSGTGNTKAAMIIEFINISFYLGFVYFCALNQYSLETIWLTEIMYWVLMGIFSLLYFKIYDWKKIIL